MDLFYKVTTPPAEEPITLAEAKAQCRVESSFTDEDELITSDIKSATSAVEMWTERAFVTQTITAISRTWPCGRSFELPRPPLVSVTSIQYYDADNTLQTLSSSLYRLNTYAEPGIVELDKSETWPDVYDRSDAIQIVFVCGYGAALAVPEDFKKAIKLLTQLHYDKRGPTSDIKVSNIPFSLEHILNSRKVYSQWTRAL